MSINKVVDNGFCIGCGACSVASSNNKIYSDGVIFKASLNGDQELATKVCPFSDDAKNEDELAKERYGNLHYDRLIGYYDSLLALRVKDKNKAVNSSSGGGITWLLEKLFETKKIDAVINVKLSDTDMYQFSMIESQDELKATSKSKYYPVTLETVKNQLINLGDKRVAITGVPCFIKAIALLEEEGVIPRISYKIALFCGHYKSKSFAELFAWQAGIKPNTLSSVDFRVKDLSCSANEYFIEASDGAGRKETAKVAKLYGSSWAYGYFKPLACEYCDDICGEVADVTFGDAWLDKYTSNSLGTNIVVSRNKELTDLMTNSEELFHELETVDNVFQSQAGNFRHRRGGGVSRKLASLSTWSPRIRQDLCDDFYDKSRTNVYMSRYELLIKSQSYFNIAKKYNSLILFKIMMSPSLCRNILYTHGFSKGGKYIVKSIIKEFIYTLRGRK